MGIVIRGMEMPSKCSECRMPDSEFGYCHAMEDTEHDTEECLFNKSLPEKAGWCPLVDVPIGHWINEPGKIPKCSVCGNYSDDADTGKAMWCPFCGAYMGRG